MNATEIEAFEHCLAEGGVAVFPADTVYGLACDPQSEAAVRRLYELKGRAPDKPAAVMFFDVDDALAALPELEPATRAALLRVLPGPVTVLVANPARRFELAGGDKTLGLRVPALKGPCRPVLQSSANVTGGPDTRLLEAVPLAICEGADLVIDGGELPGTPSTVIDLTGFEATGDWRVVREGALSSAAVKAALRE